MLNNTKKANQSIVFFNRAAKVGSQSMITLLNHLGELNIFQVALNVPAKMKRRVLTGKAQSDKVKLLQTHFENDTVYVEHVNYIDFEKFNHIQPIYINLVRDPIERVISWFFYTRSAYKNAQKYADKPHAEMMSPKWYLKDFNICVRSGDPECTYELNSIHDYMGDYRRQSVFFCGHTHTCLMFNSRIAIQIAKQNVEKHYAVVGSWEDTNVTLTVLEHFIPRYFYRARKIFELYRKEITDMNRNTRKPKIDDAVKEILRKNFTEEIEFYHFCKQRLYKQYFSLNLREMDEF